jgi:hypothetical protein
VVVGCAFFFCSGEGEEAITAVLWRVLSVPPGGTKGDVLMPPLARIGRRSWDAFLESFMADGIELGGKGSITAFS